MATNTAILGLTKPTYAEDQDVTVINANSDLIDAEAGRVRNNFAGTYSESSAYAVGDYCVYTGNLYRCTTAIGSGGEAWNSGHWTKVAAGDELTALNSNIANFGGLKVKTFTLGTYNTITITRASQHQSFIISSSSYGGGQTFIVASNSGIANLGSFGKAAWNNDSTVLTVVLTTARAVMILSNDTINYTLSTTSGTFNDASTWNPYTTITNLITVVPKSDEVVTGGAVTIQYPTGMSSTSHNYIVQPTYKTGNLLGWSATVQKSTNLILYIRQGTTTPADNSKITFDLICIKA